jgi:SAM-dependent methyltransferase
MLALIAAFLLSFSQQDSRLLSIQADIATADGRGQFYDREYRPIESSYWKLIPDWMEADARSRRVHRILDIGCGYGTLLSLASQIYRAEGFCLDLKDYLKAPVAEKYGLHFYRGNIELDPVPWKEPFDVIIMTEVLEHFNFQPVPTLMKIRQALAPGGRFFLSTPDVLDWGQQKYYRRLRDLPLPSRNLPIVDDHVWIYSRQELETAVKAAGFVIEKLSYSPGQRRARHFNLMLRRMP